jgi:hypothetical protein
VSNKKTVFIIGAGASFEFGLPVGETLKNSISGLLDFKHARTGIVSGDPLIYEALERRAQMVGREHFSGMTQAAKSIAAALPLALSIDNYLHIHHGDANVELCGKFGIVRSILTAERDSKLYSEDKNQISFAQCADTWAVKLVRVITEQCSIERLKDRLANISFIVFNYDRCLEYFLMHAFSVVYRISQEEAGKIVNLIDIYHPYGVVGNLPWMTRQDAEVIDFGGNPNPLTLFTLAASIKTFTEGTNDSDILEIRRCVREAGRLVFLGYAYHPLNMSLLLEGHVLGSETRQIFGTAFGMSKSDSEQVLAYLESTLCAPSLVIRNDTTCVNLFHEYSRNLSFN